MEPETAGPPPETAPTSTTPAPSPSGSGPRLHPVAWGVILLAAFFGAQMAAAALVTFAWVAAGGSPGALLDDVLRTPPPGTSAGPSGLGEEWTAALLLSGAAASAAVALPLSVLAHRNRFGNTRGLWGRPSARTFGWGLLAFALILGASVALEVVLQAAGAPAKEGFDSSLQARLTGILARPEILAFAIPIAGVLAPMAEETIFRGFFYRTLRDWLARGRSARGAFWGAALLSGLAWGAVHGDLVVLPVIVAFGVGLAWVYERSGSIVAPMMGHILHNTTTLLVLAFAFRPA